LHDGGDRLLVDLKRDPLPPEVFGRNDGGPAASKEIDDDAVI
jgi:hypothetical protein